MIVTEEEAKTKRCQEGYAAAYGLSEDGKQSGPIATHSSAGYSPMGGMGGAAYAVYSQPHGGAPINCLGSACMAWRTFSGAHPVTLQTIERDGSHGYCGKAGKP
jgi:hypothetical protein